jgi:HNH endonuclease
VTLLLEHWKPVVGYEDSYQISFRGNLMNRQNQIIRYSNKEGYCKYNLSKAGKKANALAHWLVAAAFIGPRPVDLCINHKDGNKRNNVVTNLEYVTRGENNRHAFRIGLNPTKLTKEEVAAIRESREGCKRLARRFGVHHQTIRRVVKGISHAQS